MAAELDDNEDAIREACTAGDYVSATTLAPIAR